MSNLFNICDYYENKRIQYYSIIPDDKYDNEFVLKCNKGVVNYLYLSNNSEFISYIKTGCNVNNNDLFNHICKLVKTDNEKSKQIFCSFIIEEKAIHFNMPKANTNLIEWMKQYNNYLIEDLVNNNEKDETIAKYLLFYFSYQEHLKEKSFYQFKTLPEINNLYATIINETDFTKWNLIPINKDRIFFAIKSSKII